MNTGDRLPVDKDVVCIIDFLAVAGALVVQVRRLSYYMVSICTVGNIALKKMRYPAALHSTAQRITAPKRWAEIVVAIEFRRP